MSDAPIVAIALLTQDDLKTLGGSFARAYPIDEIPGFEELVRQLDEVESRPKNSKSIDGT
jgi:hypothetical protein